MTEEERILAYAACRELRRLYEAYQFAAQAHRLVLARAAEAEEARAEQSAAASPVGPRLRSPDERLALFLDLTGRDLVAAQTEAVFARRSEQLRRRMLGLRGFGTAA